MTSDKLPTPVSKMALGFALLLSGGCYDEGLEIFDLDGTITVPRDAATREVTLPGESPKTITDVRLIGPVYVGMYASVDYNYYDYPYPEVQADGRVYPYAGTSVGDFRNACMEFFSCRVLSGRYENYDDLVGWFADDLGFTIQNAIGDQVVSGEQIRSECLDLLFYASDQEIGIIGDLDFEENEDGDFVADYRIWQANYREGASVWAYMDPPLSQAAGTDAFTFSTCGSDQGSYDENTYDRQYEVGSVDRDVLNVPTVLPGTYVPKETYIWNDPYALGDIVLDFKVGTDDVLDLDGTEASE